jgi:hypothetical protein
MYALDPNDHTLATERGLAYALAQNWSPERTVSEWNSALGTNFTLDDYYRATGIPRPGTATIDPVTGAVIPPVAPVTPPTVPALPTIPTLPPIPAAESWADQDMDEFVIEKRHGGIASLARGGYPRRTGQIDGPGTETSDSIPAMLSDGEFVMTAKAVRGAGNGDRRSGAKKMYALMHQLERNAARG